ncbi:ribonuclease H-like domain-containing protein [Tanacetum coccineum]
MTTLAKHIIVAGAENRPLMLEKLMYDSWASCICLFIKRKKHGRMMLDSIDNGPLVYITIKENRQTKPMKYSELTEAQQLQDDCDVQANDIILHSLPPDVYSLVNHQEAAKDIWDRVKLLMKGTELSYQERKCRFKFVTDVKLAKSLYTTNYDQLYAYLSQHERHANEVRITRERYPDPLAFVANSPTLYNPSHSPQNSGEDLIECINKAMKFLSAVASRFPPSNNQLRILSNLRNQATIQDGRVTVQQVQGRQNQSYAGNGNRGIATTSKGNYAAAQPRFMKCYNYQGEGHMARQCAQPKWRRNVALFKEKLMLAEAQEAGQILDEEQLAFLADPDCDDLTSAKAVLMANLSSCDPKVLSDVPYFDSYMLGLKDFKMIHRITTAQLQLLKELFTHKEEIDLETAQTNTSAKLPLLKQGEYEMWKLRIEQYFQVQDYALWDVIENGNSFKPVARTTTNADGTSTSLIPGPVTANEKTQKKNNVKARSMLLMALPNEHLLTFNQYKDAKTLFAAIQTRFGGNDATKKTQKTLLKQMYENFNAPSTESLDSIFNRLQKIVSQLAILGEIISQEDLNLKFLRSLPSEWNTYVVVWRNKLNLDTMSFDDLYNNFMIVEQEVKGTTSLVLRIWLLCHPLAVLMKLILLMELVLLTLKLALLALKLALLLALLSMRTRRFFQKTGRKIIINESDTAGYDKSKVECFNCHKMGHFARECRGPRNQDSRNRNQDSSRRTVNVEEISSKAMVAIDGAGFDWSYMADDEVPTNMALIDYSI